MKTLREKLTPLIRLLASENDGEALAACRAMGRVLAAHKSDFNTLADAFAEAPASRTQVVVHRYGSVKEAMKNVYEAGKVRRQKDFRE